MNAIARRVLPLAIAATVAVSLVSGLRLGGHKSVIDVQAKESFSGIEKIKTDIGEGQDFHVLEVTPGPDADHTWVGGQFGYLISGSEPTSLDTTLSAMSSLDGQSGRDRRSTYANTLISGLVNSGVASDKDDSAPLHVSRVSDTAGGEYYHELWPWDADTSDQKKLTLDNDDSVTLTGCRAVEKDGGAYNTVGSDSYVSSEGGGYNQRVTDENPYETLDSVFSDDTSFEEDRHLYVFYKLQIRKYDNTSDIPADSIIFSRKKGDTAASWEYDYLASVRHLYSSTSEYAAGGEYAAAPVMGSQMTMSLKELKDDAVSAADTGSIQSFWCVRMILREKPFEKAADGEQSYFAFSSATFRYVGAGKGDYDITGIDTANIVSDDTVTSASKTTILYSEVRYTGGYTNNNWFLRHTLDYDESDITDDVKSKVHVDYVTPEQVSEKSNDNGQSQAFADYDLVVLSAGFDPTASSPAFGHNDNAYDALDRDSALAKGLRLYLDDKGPVIADISAVSDKAFGGKSTNPLFNKKDATLPGIDQSASPATDAYGMVQNSVYVFADNATENYITMANAEYGTVFPEDQYRTEGTPFYDVYDDIVYENSIRKQNGGTELLTESASEGEAVRYIINYRNKRPRVKKDTIRVLDLEPENVKYLKDDKSEASFKKNTIMPMLSGGGYTADKVKVVTMTTNTLAGLTDELSESYDLVYIGDYRGERKDFHTSGMNGLVYYNIGGQYWNSNSALNVYTGYLDRDYDLSKQKKTTWNSYRYPGNDISKKKGAQLEAFIEQGKPVVLSDALIEKDEDTGVMSVSKKTVDANTRLYELLEDNISSHSNIMCQSDAMSASGTVEIASYVAVSAPHLNMIKEPEAYDQKDPYGHVIGGSSAYVDGKRKDGTKNLDFTFQVINETELDPARTSYNVSVYADLNNDGVFKDEEQITDLTVSRDGAAIPSDAITGDIQTSLAPTIEVSAPLPDSMQGAVTWKLVVEKNANTDIGESESDMTRCSRKGVSFVGLNDRSQKIKIRVLQICALPEFAANSSDNTFYSRYLWPGVEAMEISKSGTSTLWKYLKEAKTSNPVLDDYDIVVDSVRGAKAAYQLMTGEKNTVRRNGATVKTDWDGSWMDHYDMLLLGLSDVYGHFIANASNTVSGPSDPQVTAVYENIAEFIDNGKSVLFGHDNVFWCPINTGNTAGKTLYGYSTSASQGVNQWSTNWQTGFTEMIRILRTKAHMDLYGISDTTTTISVNGSEEYLGGSRFWNSDGKSDISSGILAQRPDSLSSAEIAQIENTTDYSVAYTPVSGGDRHANGTVSEVQGFSNATAKRIMHNIDPFCKNKADPKIYPGWTGSPDADLINPYKNQDTARGWRPFGKEPRELSADTREDKLEDSRNVDQVSKGQITSYPYNINEGDFKSGFDYTGSRAGITVSKVHGQWYTLNTNTDDINVWYTVEDTGDSRGYGYYGHDDTVNDYYIYNCGNITYTGAGHSGLDRITEQEAKLWVNTIIASYRVSESKPEAEFVTNAKGDTKTDSVSIRAYTDPDIREKSSGGYSPVPVTVEDAKTKISSAISSTKVYFKIEDSNIAKNKTFQADFFSDATRDDDSAAYTVDDADKIDLKCIYDPETDKKVDYKKLSSRKVYYIRLSDTKAAIDGLSDGSRTESELYLRPAITIGSGEPSYGDVIKLDIRVSQNKLFRIG